jgi:hypothetical protein
MFCGLMKRLTASVKLTWHFNSGWETRRRVGGAIRLWQFWSRFLCFRRENWTRSEVNLGDHEMILTRYDYNENVNRKPRAWVVFFQRV